MLYERAQSRDTSHSERPRGLKPAAYGCCGIAHGHIVQEHAVRELWRLTASEAIRGVRRGDFSVTEWAESCLRRIEETDGAIKAWAHFDPQRFLDQARSIETAIHRGKPAAALGGAPVGVKDIFNTIDMPTCMGSPIWKGFQPGNDARVVYSLRHADGVVAGKTVTAEFAVHAPNQAVNPWHPSHSPGTSSSGSAAAVAAGMVPLALGTQTAGSIIRPASYCGCFGMKPSFGLVPRTGMLKTTDSLDTVGLLARSVEDCALLFDVLRVHGPDYPFVHRHLNDPARQDKQGPQWRVGILTTGHWTFQHAQDYARHAIVRFHRQLEALPCVLVEPLVLPGCFERSHDVFRTIYHKALSYYFQEEAEQRRLVSPVMYEIIEDGRTISLEEYRSAQQEQNRLAAELDQILTGYDVVCALSTAGHAPAAGTAIDPPDTCLIWTMCRAPVVNVPVAHSPQGLPLGIQAVARRYSDLKLLKFLDYLREEGIVPATSAVAPCSQPPAGGGNPVVG